MALHSRPYPEGKPPFNSAAYALEMPEPPDLQKLVVSYGGYHKIPVNEWEKYDRQLAATHAWLEAHHRILKEKQ
jgi:hypothetical protein